MRSQFPNGITKMKKLDFPKNSYGGMSPDLLRVTNISFRDKPKFPKKYAETITFYKEMPITMDIRASDYRYREAKISPQIVSKSTTREFTSRVTCDAVSNTELSIA